MAGTLELVGGRINRARIYYENVGDLYIAIGRTSPWNDEENPPDPTGLETNVEEVIGFKKVDQFYFVVEDEVGGNLTFRGKTWRIVTVDNIFIEQSRWIYVSASIVGDELPLSEYRQVGLYSGLVPSFGFENADVLLPNQIDNSGVLEILGNRKFTPRQADQTEKAILIMEF